MTAKKNLSPLIELDEVESTNNYAMGWIQGTHLPKGHEHLINGTGILAYHQTAGKGQRGKSWLSPRGESLSLSIVLQPHFLNPNQGFSLLSATAVAAAEVLKRYTGDETKIKWPNDLYWQSRKLGGILIENVVKGTQFQWSIAGIGINIRQRSFPEFLGNPVSIKQITGNDVAIKEVALQLQEEMINAIDALRNDPLAFFDHYNRLLFCRHQTVKLRQGSRVFETTIKGVNTLGELMTGEDGATTFRFGEVEWKL
ncbi:MAG TPA: biotin--[acetyl-CoA-carboxylase] ligase [Lacibacter sp.]|nr:biotin--[acetyl-CoA-carboxylase] ligase [Lacibacter sp.]